MRNSEGKAAAGRPSPVPPFHAKAQQDHQTIQFNRMPIAVAPAPELRYPIELTSLQLAGTSATRADMPHPPEGAAILQTRGIVSQSCQLSRPRFCHCDVFQILEIIQDI